MRVVASNVPSFFLDDEITNHLSPNGMVMDLVCSLLLGSKVLELQHVLSFKREVFMLFDREGWGLPHSISFIIDRQCYEVYLSTGDTSCFRCGSRSHLTTQYLKKMPATVEPPEAVPVGPSPSFSSSHRGGFGSSC